MADLGPQEEIIAVNWDSLHANGTLNVQIEKVSSLPISKKDLPVWAISNNGWGSLNSGSDLFHEESLVFQGLIP